MATIQIEDGIALALRAQADARGLSLAGYLRAVAEQVPEHIAPPKNDPLQGAQDFDAALDELFAGDTRDLPSSSLTYTRDEIYFDHD